jgi:surface polysaccharide O-acyltransferase-like enzyme
MTAAELAAATPASRNRVVDLWRVVAICCVVLGHWLAASIWVRPDGGIDLLNALEWIPYAGWVTWLVQVMPVFFLVGGFANARALRRVEEGESSRDAWVTVRARRLMTPAIPLLLVWVVLIVVLRPFVPHEVVYAGAMSATVPLWFLAVYLILTVGAPVTHAWWRRAGLASVVALAVAAVAVDALRFGLDLRGLGYLNFLFVWGAVHQLGYWWADRDPDGISAVRGWTVAGLALATLIVLTSTGVYPVAMVGVGTGDTNMTPPTTAILLLALVQAGVIWATQPVARRLTQRPRVWRTVVTISGVIMTLYLWHLSAMSLLAAAGLFTADGAVFQVEPGTTRWWSTRPLWIGSLLVVTAILIAAFGRFERQVSDAPPPRRRRVLTVGVLLCVASLAAVANFGISSPDAVVHWSLPIAAVLGAALLGALPRQPGGPGRQHRP